MKIKYTFRAHNLLMLVLLAALNFIGILILRSAANNDTAIVTRQIIGSLAGYFACLVVSFIDYNKLAKYSKIAYGVVIGILFAVLIWGATHKGAGRWIVLPVVGQIQPAEFSKAGLILFFAALFGRYGDRINSPRNLLRAAALFAVPTVMVLLEPNLSTTIILCVIFIIMLATSGLDLRLLALGIVAVSVVTGVVLFLISTDNYRFIPFLREYQANRILSFIDPTQHSDTMFQQNNSIMAIGSGGFFGKGINNTDISSVKAGNFLIEEDTDFIFAIIGEELGFRGCLAVLGMYLALILLMLWIALKSRDTVGSAICIGVAAWIGFQTFTNVAVATAIFPNTGVTLPFFSRGSSSLMALYLGCGMVLNVGMQSKD